MASAITAGSRVRMPGGTLQIDVRPDWSIRLQGPVEEVYTGTLSHDLMDALVAELARVPFPSG